jgi:hypothetical protein
MTEEDQDGDDLEGEMFEKFMMHSSRYSRRSLAEQQAAEEQAHKRPLLHEVAAGGGRDRVSGLPTGR